MFGALSRRRWEYAILMKFDFDKLLLIIRNLHLFVLFQKEITTLLLYFLEYGTHKAIGFLSYKKGNWRKNYVIMDRLTGK